MTKTIEILIVDDDADHIDLMSEAFEESKFNARLTSVSDGVEAMTYLRREGKYASATRPAIIFLDLNMPRKDGRQVLAELKEDPSLKDIPVTVLSTSHSEEDISQAYKLHANCYLSKPQNMAGLVQMVKSVESFWFGMAELPSSH